jgi:hypothetical protein
MLARSLTGSRTTFALFAVARGVILSASRVILSASRVILSASRVILSAAKDLLPAASTFVLCAALSVPVFAGAQNPSRSWRTIHTPHFRVHFTPELDSLARRAAASAESSYTKLSAYLRPPRGTIDLVVSDNVDYTNGSATPFPSNRIVIYANPPVDDDALRFADDPTELIVLHELVHIFHLDRSRGVWRLLRGVFGRDPGFFPNAYQPSWLVEGLAVYFESALTGSGRLEGSNHRMIARTAAANRTFPRIDELSLSSPKFPYGTHAYAYGSLFIEHLAKTYGDSSLRRFVEGSSLSIPMWLNLPARGAFHTTFTSAYTRWRDSLQQEPSPASPAIAGWRDLTMHGAYAQEPRWLSDSTVSYVGTDGRTTYGAYKLTLRDSALLRARIGRRDTRSAQIALPDGSFLFSKLEYSNPYDLRSDLYVESPRAPGRLYFDRSRTDTRRLTHGARLSRPDVRADGLIVAMQIVPAGTRLALVTIDGKSITPITSGSLAEQWTEPRWSPDGQRIAAIRWTLGGTWELVVVDTTGAVAQTLLRERAVIAGPNWSPDGSAIYFSSDRTGISNLYRVSVGAEPVVQRVSDTQTGLFDAQVSPNGQQLLAVAYRADGFHVGIAQLDSLQPVTAEAIERVAPRAARPVTSHQSPVTKYSAWRSLRPRYWEPYWEAALDSNSLRLGVFTAGQDVVGRHAYQTLLYVPTDNSGITGAFGYRNARFGQPVIDLSASMDRDNFRCIADASQQNQCVGFLRRRIRETSLATTFNRVRARSSAFISVGAGIELRDYSTKPESLQTRIDSLYQHLLMWPRATISMGWSNAQRPQLAISPEDGVSFALTTRMRWRRESPPVPSPVGPDTVDAGVSALSAVATLSMYKSMPFPGFSHHVLAIRAAGGWVDSRNPSYLEVGGISGGVVEVFPGYNLGEGRRTFGIRGFPAASMIGMRAYTFSGEYRAPLALAGRGLGVWPAFLDRTFVNVFAELGSAWCPSVYPSRPSPAYSLCTQGDVDIGRTTALTSLPIVHLKDFSIGSVGAELSASAAVLGWDQPITYRLGMARPVIGRNLRRDVPLATAYLAVGLSF